MRRAQAGEREALEELLRTHYDLVYQVCRRITGDPTDAADAAQEALIGMTRGLGRFDSRSRFSTWAYRAAVNASIDELRRRRRRLRLVGAEAPAAAFRAAPADPAEEAGDRVDVDSAMRRLPPDLRAAVALRDLCGLDYGEIASVLGIPVGTAKSRVSRARAELARHFEAP